MPTQQEKEQWLASQLHKPHGEDGIQVGEMMNKGNRTLYDNTLQFLKPKAGAYMVETGMGNGAFVREILAYTDNLKYTGCDFSELMVQESRKRNEGVVNADFVLTEAKNLPFDDATVDHIITVNTIYFWEDVTATLQEFARVLKPGGQLLIGMRPKRSMGKFGFVKYGFNMLETEEVQSHLTSNGFEVKDVFDKTEGQFEVDEVVYDLESLVFNAYKS